MRLKRNLEQQHEIHDFNNRSAAAQPALALDWHPTPEFAESNSRRLASPMVRLPQMHGGRVKAPRLFQEKSLPKSKRGGQEANKNYFVVVLDGAPIAVFQTVFAAEHYALQEGGQAYAVPLLRKRAAITPEILKALLRYEADSGKVFWRERGRQYFDSDVSHRRFNEEFAGKEALNSLSSHGYFVGKVLRLPISAHRAIFAIVHDGDRTNNRLTNLRETTQRDNTRNSSRPRSNLSGRVGVTWKENVRKWRVTICSREVGNFDTFEEACAARSFKERELGFHPNHGRESTQGASLKAHS